MELSVSIGSLQSTVSVVAKKPPRKVGPRPWFTYGGKTRMLVSSKSMGSVGIGKTFGAGGRPFTMERSTTSTSLVGVGKMMLNDGLDDDGSIVGSRRARAHSASRNRWVGHNRSRVNSFEGQKAAIVPQIPKNAITSYPSYLSSSQQSDSTTSSAVPPIAIMKPESKNYFVTRISVAAPKIQRPENYTSPVTSPRNNNAGPASNNALPMTPSSRLLGQDSMVEGSLGGEGLEWQDEGKRPRTSGRQTVAIGQREVTLGAWSEREEDNNDESAMFQRRSRGGGRKSKASTPHTPGSRAEKKTRLMERLERRNIKGPLGR
mmetsp:Transcript_8483/g.17161  ORF Transcript_8483/g.17161 Transcript_8483/m.17161 type:complete len:318 (+) Transcript_8483:1151-2104(+)